MISKEEALEIKTDVALLKQSTADTLQAIHEQADSQNKLLASVNDLTLEIKEDRIKREASEERRELQDSIISESITQNKLRIDEIESKYSSALERLLVSQSRWDKFINAMFSKAGTSALIIVVVAVLYALGINPKDFKG